MAAGGAVLPAEDPAALLERAARRVGRTPGAVPGDGLRVGVDLGTASCVLVVLDSGDQPIWLDAHPSGALRDGVVVDFARAAGTVRRLRERAEQALGTLLTAAAAGYPPCVPAADARACSYVCE